jgi:AAA+ superfamily predicted ATPase
MLDQLNWESVPNDEAQKLANLAFQGIDKNNAGEIVFGATIARLPFYSDFRLCQVKAHHNDNLLGQCYLLWDCKNLVFLLNGKSAVIHEANEAAHLNLTPQNTADYIRFFLFGILGEKGRFVLVEKADSQDTNEKNAIAQYAAPLTYVGQDNQDRAEYKAVVAYNGSLFSVLFSVSKNGIVEIGNDVLLAQDIPLGLIKDDPNLDGAEAINNFIFGDKPKDKEAQSTRPAFVVLTEILLERAISAQNNNKVIAHFNAINAGVSELDQFAKMVISAAPIIAVESTLPFIEELIGWIVKERSQSELKVIILSEQYPSLEYQNEKAKCLVLLPISMCPGIKNIERLSYDLSVNEYGAIITCEKFTLIPESLRVISDIVLKLPAIDAGLFEEWFKRMLGTSLPPELLSNANSWCKYVLHTDFEQPIRMKLSPDKAYEYIRDQVIERMSVVDAVTDMGLNELHGLGEAREFAEDLISDIHSALQGKISWQQVDRGALLVGPPGTGKTTLAKAIAKDCNIRFIQGSAAGWQAAGNLDDHIKAIRSTFAEARRYAPSILFIDEIDSLGNREQFSDKNAIYQTEVVNAVLEQMQGFDESAPVVVLGATNNENRVDPALKRSGRLDFVIRIPRPNSHALSQIYKYYISSTTTPLQHSDIDVLALGKLSVGLTGADIERIVRGAVRRARKNNREMSQSDLIAELTNKPRNPDNILRLDYEELERTAYHEAGHALALFLSRSKGSDIGFVTIVPRNDGTLGFVAPLHEDRTNLTREDYRERIEIFLAGRASEAFKYGEEQVSSGAASDLRAATALAIDMIKNLGASQERKLLWSDTATHKDIEQAGQLLSDIYDGFMDKLQDNKEALVRLAEEIIAKQELTGDDVRKILQN